MSGYTNMDDGAPPAYSSSHWLEQQESKSRKSKWIVIGVLSVVLFAVGAAIGVTVSKLHSSASSHKSPSSGSAGVVSQKNSSDPSSFVKDPNLKHSFYGLAYTPEGSQLPECGNSLDAVIEDVQLMSQLTSRLRLYGADCNQSALVLEAIKQTKVNMSVYLGIYNVPTDGGAAYVRQRDTIVDALKTYGADNVLGVTVGNEFILDFLEANGGGDLPNGDVGNAGAALLISNITDARQTFGGLGLSKTLPIGNADAGSFFNNEVLEAVDYGMSNVHPWFANVSINDAAGWTADFFQENNVALANSLTNKPQMFIAETGWPTDSSDAGNESNGPSTASAANLQIFLDTFVCQANQNGTGYFYFEYFDEAWKAAQFGGVEGFWGLFNGNKTLKAITIPDCEID
ncbi:glycoside hydrolase [Cytidiella melzeri]|nr:glycoside hydrolase [Cytidiella melzeri]